MELFKPIIAKLARLSSKFFIMISNEHAEAVFKRMRTALLDIDEFSIESHPV